MDDVELKPRIQVAVDLDSGAQVAAIASISAEEFAWGQIVLSDLANYYSYQDWLDSREGFQIGLSAAGVEVRTVPVALSPFLIWCRLTQTTPCERALDAFALMLAILRNRPSNLAMATVRESEFERHAQSVEAFTPFESFRDWTEHRDQARADLSAAGLRIERLPIKVGDFIEWSRCLGESTSEVLLDSYAALILEFLIQDADAEKIGNCHRMQK